MKANFLPRAWVRRAISRKTTRFRSETNRQLKVKGVIRLKVQLGQRIVETSFLIAANLDTEMILGAANINENINKISSSKGTVKLTGSSSGGIEESVGNTVHMANSLE